MTIRKLITYSIVLIALNISAMVTAQVVEPRKIDKPSELQPGEGAVLLSIRHQTPIAETMHVYFESVDDPSRLLKFERKVGLGGRTRMLARQVAVYAVPAGRWRLTSHVAGCDGNISPEVGCALVIGTRRFPTPSGTYGPTWYLLEVLNGGYTDANEINLEFPPDINLTVPFTGRLEERARILKFKARVIPESDKTVASSFVDLKRGQIEFAEEAVSASTCEKRAKDLKLYYNPFTC